LKKIKHQFSFDEKNIALIEYANIYLGNRLWLDNKMGLEETTFELTVREMPKNWGYFLFFGLDRFLELVKNFRFGKEEIKVLRDMHLIEKRHEKFYKNFKFNGDIWSIEEGTPFFEGQPIIRVTGTMIEANLMTALILNSFSYPVRNLTKITRLNNASGKKNFSSAGSVRAQGMEQILINLLSCHIGGSQPSIQPISYFSEPNIPRNTFQANINHATIKSFPNERDAIKFAIQKVLPSQASLQIMVDTYNVKTGLKILIEETKKISKKEQSKISVPIDSGDVYQTAKYMRKELDKNNLQHIKICAFCNLDEYKISALEKKKAPIDFYIGVTEVINVTDAPRFEAVYKMSEVIYPNGKREYKAKLAKGKKSYPGRKQIFRQYNNKGIMKKDVIALETEKIDGEKLLKQFVKNGNRIKKQEDINKTKRRVEESLSRLPKYTKEIHTNKKYPVEVSKKIKEIIRELKKKHT
jgi:nicotinate phosphoribosyltransferase